MKATLLLRKDHEKLRELFGKYRESKTSDQGGRRALLETIRKEIAMHSSIEAEIFYPELRNSVSEKVDTLTQAALEDHKRMEEMLMDLEASVNAGNDKRFDAKVIQLMETVERHIEAEEEEMFAEARLHFSEQRLEELGLEMESRKQILSQIAA